MISGSSNNIEISTDGTKVRIHSTLTGATIVDKYIYGIDTATLFINGSEYKTIKFSDPVGSNGYPNNTGYSSMNVFNYSVKSPSDIVTESNITDLTQVVQPQPPFEVNSVSYYPLSIGRGSYSFIAANETQADAFKEFLGIYPVGVDIDTYLKKLDMPGLEQWLNYWLDRFRSLGISSSNPIISFAVQKKVQYLTNYAQSQEHEQEIGIIRIKCKRKIEGAIYTKVVSLLSKVVNVVTKLLPTQVKIQRAEINHSENSIDLIVTDTAPVTIAVAAIAVAVSLVIGIGILSVTYIRKSKIEAEYDTTKEDFYNDLINYGISPKDALAIVQGVYSENTTKPTDTLISQLPLLIILMVAAMLLKK